MSVIDPTEREASLEREGEALRARVAELERKLARFDGQAGLAELGTGLAEREGLLAEVELIAHLGSWVWDVPLGRVVWSHELYRLLGYDPERDQASTEAFFARIHPEDRERVQTTSQRGITTGVAERVDFRVLLPDGVVRYVTMNGALLFDEHGALRRAVGSVLDISELKIAALEVRRSTELLDAAMQAAKLCIVHFDPRSGRSDASAALAEMTGLDLASSPGPSGFRACVDPRDRDAFDARVAQVMTLTTPEPLELRFRRPDGRVLTLYITATLVHEADGEFAGVRVSILDVTERAELEERLRQSQKMEAVGQLAGGIAHDFNNLLTVIQASAELLAHRQPGTELTDIGLAARRAAELVARLLAFSRRSVLALERLDPVPVLDGALVLLRRLLPESIHVRRIVEGAPWPITGDRAQLEQVVLNLALNARDAMRSGGQLTLTLRNAVLSCGGEVVELEVADTGIGMDDATRERAFEPFFTTKAVGEGTGLGLAMVFGSAKQLGGSVELRSCPGHGTAVIVRLPRARCAARPDEASPDQPAPGDRRGRVLLVEDSEPLRRILSAVLTSAGHACVVYGDPREVLADVEHLADVDVLVTDLVMPGMDGLALAAELRRSLPALPVLLITGYAPGPLELPGDGHHELMRKPFAGDELIERVARLLASAGRGTGPAG